MFSAYPGGFHCSLGMTASPQRLGFGFGGIEELKKTAHLPAPMAEGIAHYRAVMERNNQ